MRDVSYVRFVTKVSAWNRTIYAAFEMWKRDVAASLREPFYAASRQLTTTLDKVLEAARQLP